MQMNYAEIYSVVRIKTARAGFRTSQGRLLTNLIGIVGERLRLLIPKRNFPKIIEIIEIIKNC